MDILKRNAKKEYGRWIKEMKKNNFARPVKMPNKKIVGSYSQPSTLLEKILLAENAMEIVLKKESQTEKIWLSKENNYMDKNNISNIPKKVNTTKPRIKKDTCREEFDINYTFIMGKDLSREELVQRARTYKDNTRAGIGLNTARGAILNE